MEATEKDLLQGVKFYAKFNLNTSKNEKIRVSILIKCGHSHTLTHKTNIRGSREDLERILFNGTAKPNTKSKTAQRLSSEILNEMKHCRETIEKHNINVREVNSETFEEYFNNDGVTKNQNGVTKTLLEEFRAFICAKKSDVSNDRIVHYNLLYNVFERFLLINYPVTDIFPNDFTEDQATEFADFYINEYKYVNDYLYLYENMKKQNVPTAERSNNTTAVKINQMKAFFAYMVDKGIVSKNVFKSVNIRERYDRDKIFSLTLDELNKIKESDVSARLQVTKDAFLFQCYTGMRINEFAKLTKQNVMLTAEGIPYIYYKASKTQDVRKTALIRTAFELLKKNDFTFQILKNISGQDGYNKRIKELCRECGIDRNIVYIDEETGMPVSVPIYEMVSNKYARKTRVDIFPKQYVNNLKYLSGMHSKGSEAVNHYTDVDTDVTTDFKLANMVFQEKPYKVDKDFNVIEE